MEPTIIVALIQTAKEFGLNLMSFYQKKDQNTEIDKDRIVAFVNREENASRLRDLIGTTNCIKILKFLDQAGGIPPYHLFNVLYAKYPTKDEEAEFMYRLRFMQQAGVMNIASNGECWITDTGAAYLQFARARASRQWHADVLLAAGCGHKQ